MSIFHRPWNDESPPLLPYLALRAPPNFETSFDTYKRRRAVLNALATHQPEARGTIRRIAGCRGEGNCGSGACPPCNRRFRNRLLCEAIDTLNGHQHEILRFSMIPRNSRFEPRALCDLNLAAWTKSRHRALSRALPDGTLCIAGTDLSLNTFENATPHWCAHLYGFILLPKDWGIASKVRRNQLRATIADRCPLLGIDDRIGAEVPLKVSEWTWEKFQNTLLYAHKPTFYRRSRYSYTKRKTGKQSTNVVAQSLKAAELADASVVLDGSPLGSRLIMIGMRRRGGFADFKLHLERRTSRHA